MQYMYLSIERLRAEATGVARVDDRHRVVIGNYIRRFPWTILKSTSPRRRRQRWRRIVGAAGRHRARAHPHLKPGPGHRTSGPIVTTLTALRHGTGLLFLEAAPAGELPRCDRANSYQQEPDSLAERGTGVALHLHSPTSLPHLPARSGDRRLRGHPRRRRTACVGATDRPGGGQRSRLGRDRLRGRAPLPPQAHGAARTSIQREAPALHGVAGPSRRGGDDPHPRARHAVRGSGRHPQRRPVDHG